MFAGDASVLARGGQLEDMVALGLLFVLMEFANLIRSHANKINAR